MLNSAWKKARERAGLPQVRVHDLKHTFGRRLRAAGVSFEDRQDLLGHRSGRITTHYSAAELCRVSSRRPRQVCDRRRQVGRNWWFCEAGYGGGPANVPQPQVAHTIKVGQALKRLVAEAGLEPATFGL